MLFGLSACVDARILAHELTPLFAPDAPPQAQSLRRNGQGSRAAQASAVKCRIDWPEGPAWLARHLPITYALGGTGPQAAWSLAVIGAPALIALEDRSAHKLRQVHPEHSDRRERQSASRRRHRTARYRVGPRSSSSNIPLAMTIDDVTPKRSSRIIVRFHDPGLEHDDAIRQAQRQACAEAGAGLISGFNCIPYDKIDSRSRAGPPHDRRMARRRAKRHPSRACGL